jgi:hypothetical protein
VLATLLIAGLLLPLIWLLPRASAAPTYPGQIGVGVSMGWNMPFVDTAKTLRPFELATGGVAPTDENGWPTSDARTVLWDMRPVEAWAGNVDDPEQFTPNMAGTYKLSFTGQATLGRVDGVFEVQNQRYDEASNTTTVDLVIPASADATNNIVFIDFSATKRMPSSPTGSGITNLRVIRPGYPANTDQVFHTPFLNALKSANFSTLRFMGWSETNNNHGDHPTRLEWSERKLPTDATQSPWGAKKDGGAWEHVIALSNTTGKDVWINVPVNATDDYVRQLATLVKSDLNPNLKVYIEYSNEVWNWSFPQATWNRLNAEAQGLNYIKGYAKRTAEISKLFAEVFGQSAMNNRVRVVNAWQVGWNPPDFQYNEQMEYINDNFGPPNQYVWGVAVAPYHNCEPVCKTGSPQEILDAMRASSDASVEARKKVKAVADTWQLPGGMLAYEGGSDTGGGDKTNVANKIAAERAPGMKDIMVRDLRDNWFPHGGGLFMYLEMTSGYNRYGSWGLTDDVTNPDRNAKFAAVRELLGNSPAPIGTAAPNTATPTGVPTTTATVEPTATEPTATATAEPSATATTTATTEPNPTGALRIDVGASTPFTDAAGQVWQVDTGFTGGGAFDRGNVAIAGTDNDRLYQTERFGMTGYALPLAKGAYTVKLHFAETYDGITAAGQRVFDVNVEGTPIANLDVFAESGGLNRALVKTVDVTVADGALTLAFTPKVQNTLLNALEIVPTGGSTPTAATATATTPPVTSTATVSATNGPAVTRLLLINADTNRAIGPLTEGATLDLATLPTRNLSVQALTNPTRVGSVRFDLDNGAKVQTENTAPYALAGDTRGDFLPWTPSAGAHSLTVTAHSGRAASGTPGAPITVRFTVTNGGAAPTATGTAAPTATGTAAPTATSVAATKTATSAPTATSTPAATAAATVTPTVAPASPTATSAPITGAQRWSDAATWGGSVPQAGQAVVVPVGKTVLMDVSPPALKSLQIDGTLIFDNKDLALSAGWIMLHGDGILRIGSEQQPFRNKATITLTATDSNENVMDMGTRGILLMGGALELYGVAPNVAWMKLNAHAEANATTLQLKDSVNWKAGDQLAIAPTDFYGVAETERLQIASVSGATVNLTGGVQKFRWGRLQYVTDEGMSLTPDPDFTPPATPFPTVLDQRAEVGNLTRNIVIQGADDDLWKNQGFGAHIMAMQGSEIKLDGVELRRVGQAGKMGRYPIHWHMLSYDSTGKELGDATGQFVRNSAIWDSQSRCITIHGTNGLTLRNNICYDIKGHAIFLEDAVERRNVIENNLTLKMRVPAKPLQKHDTEVFQGGPSGFWLTNPDNIVRGNAAADAQGNGFWMSFPRKPLGLSKNVKILPDRLPHGVFEDNVGHSTRAPAVMLEWVPTNDAGDLSPNKYIPTRDGGEDRYNENRVRFTLKRITTYKSLDGGYRNRVSWPDYIEWVAADNVGTVFAGAGDDGLITRSLIVSTSLNNRTPYPNPNEPPVAFASYHSTFDMKQNVLVNFPFVEGKSSGAFKTDDYYITAVDKGTISNPDNRLINSHPGYRTPPPNMRSDARPNDNWTLAGALWDPHGYWGPKGNYWTYDVPFLTSGASCQPVAPAGKNGVSCNGEYYGVDDFLTDFDTRRYSFKAPIEVIRQDERGAEIDKWTVADGDTSNMLGNMRHFAARPGGRYVLRFPGKPLPKRFEMTVTNAFRAGDSFVMAVSFDGRVTPSAYTVVGQHNRAGGTENAPASESKRIMTAAGSLAEVTSGPGDRFWQDTANNLVWFKYQGGLRASFEDGFAPNSDEDLYRARSVVIYAKP